MKTVVLTGFGATKNDRTYRKLFPHALVFAPRWERRTPSDYKKEFESFVKAHGLKDGTYDAYGFSMGAYILAVSNVKPRRSFYASTSPLFEQEVQYWPPYFRRFLGKRRRVDLRSYLHKPRSFFFVGEHEPSFVKNCTKRLSKGKHVVVPNARHNVRELFPNGKVPTMR